MNSSRFLRRGFLLSRKFIVLGAPGYAHLPSIKFLHRDKFLAPINPDSYRDVPRSLRKVASNKFLHRDLISATWKVCTAIAPERQINCTMMAKTAPCFASYGLRKILLKTIDSANALRSTQQCLLMLTAGPLAGIKNNIPR